MFLVPVDEQEISLITSDLKSKASSGDDELSSYSLTQLVHIINTSITTGIVPKNYEGNSCLQSWW